MSVSQSVKDELLENLKIIVPDLHSLLLIDYQGNLLSYYASQQCANNSCLSELKNIAKLVSIRFRIGGFPKLLGGLQMTINEFENYFMLVKGIYDDNILAIMVPRQANLDEIRAILFSFEKYISTKKQNNDFLPSGLKPVLAETTEFQKNQEKLQSRTYTFVAYPLKRESEYSKKTSKIHSH